MAYSEPLAAQVEGILSEKGVSFEARRMMGGLCFMVDDKMCVGITDDLLMARIDPDLYEEALTRPGCRAMDFTGRPMRGFVFVAPEEADSVAEWVQLCLDFNPKAKRSKKRKRKKG